MHRPKKPREIPHETSHKTLLQRRVRARALAATAIILLVTSELLSPYYGKTNLTINKERLRNVALTFSTLFLVTVAMRIISIIISP